MTIRVNLTAELILFEPIWHPTVFQVLVQNIAIADMGYTLVVIFPTIFTTTVMSNTWTLGTFTCNAIAVLQFVFGTGNILMICALNVCKLTCLLYPFQGRLRSVRSGCILVSILWTLALVYPIQTLALHREMKYDDSIYRCMFGDRAGTIWELLDPINGGVFMFIPLIIIVITTAWLLVIVFRSSSNKQGLLVVLSVSIVFILSWCPLLAYNLYHPISYPPQVFYQIGVFFIFINAASNPLLYLLTSRSFKVFVLRKMFRRQEASEKKTTVSALRIKERMQISANPAVPIENSYS